MTKSFRVLENFHPGSEIFIVGKGPSLAFLTAEVFFPSRCPIICLNDSILVVQAMGLSNPLYSLQKDGDARYMVEPSETTHLLLQSTPGYSGEYFPDHTNRYLVDPVTELGFEREETTATEMAIAIARSMGCSHIHMCCCDILVNGNTGTFDPFARKSVNDAYKTAIYSYAKERIMEQLRSISHDFIIPKEQNV